MEDTEIIAASKALKCKLDRSAAAGKKGKGGRPASSSSTSFAEGPSKVKDNNWIPSESVKVVNDILRDTQIPDSEIGNTARRILYDLNMIWRKIMRKENEAIKKRLTA